MANWTKILTTKEKAHLREYAARLTGLYDKKVVIENLRTCDCLECKAILNKLVENK